MTAECPQLRISQVGQKIPPIKLQDFFKWTNQWLQLEPLTKVDRSGHPTSRSKIILTNQMTWFATRVGQNSCKNRCHLFWLTDAVALIGLCNWITIANITRSLTANSAITGSLRKFYVGRMTALTTPRSAPGSPVTWKYWSNDQKVNSCTISCPQERWEEILRGSWHSWSTGNLEPWHLFKSWYLLSSWL